MVSSKNTFVQHTVFRRNPGPTELEVATAKRISEIASLTLPSKKALKSYFSETKWAQPRWATHLSPLWGRENLDVHLKNLANEINDVKLGFRFPESMAEYVEILWIKDASIFGIILALRSELVVTKAPPPQVMEKSQREKTKDAFVIGHRAKDDFLSLIWRHTDEDISSTGRFLIFTPNSRRKDILLHLQRTATSNKSVVEFWQKFIATNTDMVSIEEDDWKYDDTTSTFTKLQGDWTYTFTIPVRFFRDKKELPKNNTSSVEYFQKMLEEVKIAKWEFRALLEGILSTSQGKSAPGTRWTKKPANYHLNLDWDNGFYVQLDGERRTIDIVYRVWHHRDLYYGKELLRNLREDQLSPCTVSGDADRRIIEYTTENGWKMRFSLA